MLNGRLVNVEHKRSHDPFEKSFEQAEEVIE
jgi:hypothetical protein